MFYWFKTNVFFLENTVNHVQQTQATSLLVKSLSFRFPWISSKLFAVL